MEINKEPGERTDHRPAGALGQVSKICRTAFLSPVIVEKLIDGTLPAPRFTAVADKLITLPLWAEQHKLLGIE